MSTKRFRIAFSFAGEKRDFVKKVADLLAKRFSEAAILYDKFHEAEFANADLAFDLPSLYKHDTDILERLALNEGKPKDHHTKPAVSGGEPTKPELRVARAVGYGEGIAYITCNLAQLAFIREDWSTAETLARESLPLAEKVGRLDLIAGANHSLANALVRQGRAAEALAPCPQGNENLYTPLLSPPRRSPGHPHRVRGGFWGVGRGWIDGVSGRGRVGLWPWTAGSLPPLWGAQPAGHQGPRDARWSQLGALAPRLHDRPRRKTKAVRLLSMKRRSL